MDIDFYNLTVTDEDMFGNRESTEATNFSSYLCLYFLRLNSRARCVTAPPPKFYWNRVSKVATLQAYFYHEEFEKLFNQFLFFFGELDVDERMRIMMRGIYHFFSAEYNPHVGFSMVCSFAMEAVLYCLQRRQPNASRLTVKLLARVLTSKLFTRQSSFEHLNKNAEFVLRHYGVFKKLLHLYGAWRRVRNVPRALITTEFREFLVNEMR